MAMKQRTQKRRKFLMRKKILAVILAYLLLVNAGAFCVFAEEVTNDFEPLDSIENIDISAHKEESDRLAALGQQMSKRRATVVLSGFTNLQQGDSRWKNEIMMTEGKTIGSAGCCLTSFTMIQQYYGGTDSPAQVNSKLGNSACPFVYADAASKYGYTYNLASDMSYAINYIKGAICSGNPVLVGMTSSSGTHFVAAYGYDDNNIIISDPASRNYQYLSQYLNTGYSIYRLCTYFK